MAESRLVELPADDCDASCGGECTQPVWGCDPSEERFTIYRCDGDDQAPPDCSDSYLHLCGECCAEKLALECLPIEGHDLPYNVCSLEKQAACPNSEECCGMRGPPNDDGTPSPGHYKPALKPDHVRFAPGGSCTDDSDCETGWCWSGTCLTCECAGSWLGGFTVQFSCDNCSEDW